MTEPSSKSVLETLFSNLYRTKKSRKGAEHGTTGSRQESVMKIGQLSIKSGFSRDTIRYYEKLGLLVVEDRNPENEYKNYGNGALERLLHIQRLKDVGFTLREIRPLLISDSQTNPCKNLPQQLAQKLEKIDAQIAILLDFKASLLVVQRACNGNCTSQNGMPVCIPQATAALPAAKCC